MNPPDRTSFSLPPPPPLAHATTRDRSSSIASSHGADIDLHRPLPPPPPGPAFEQPPTASYTDPLQREVQDEQEEVLERSEEDEEGVPELCRRELFLPLPQIDPLSTLLAKFVPAEARPPRDLTGRWEGLELDGLLASNSWRAVATYARDNILRTPSSHIPHILSLWTLRLHALTHLRLSTQASAELNAIWPHVAALEIGAVPFELRVLRARVDGTDALAELVRWCGKMGRRAEGVEEKEMWKERKERVGVVLAGLVASSDPITALNLIAPLSASPSASPTLLSSQARLHLSLGSLPTASDLLARAAAHPDITPSQKFLNTALLALASDDTSTAITALEELLHQEPENIIAQTNLSVLLLSRLSPSPSAQSTLDRAISTLKTLLSADPTRATIEPVLFDLATLYELRGVDAPERKKAMLLEAAKWAGDGVRGGCLKLS